jgi:hypothetical protein
MFATKEHSLVFPFLHVSNIQQLSASAHEGVLMLRAVIQNIAVVGGIIILSRQLSVVWQCIIGALLLVLGLVTMGLFK